MPKTRSQETRDKLIILSIEDDYEYAYLLREMLTIARDAPFELVHADQLATGQKRLETETFDLILLDLSLPDSWGFDTFASVHNQAPDVPIIILSSLSDKKLAMRAVQKGALDYLVKGQVDANRLRRAIHHAVEQNQTKETS
ncbi:MAG: response regulator [Chloroflexi bacterium]|nr:response regulator [Chloroflexota bacterium]